MYKIDASMWKCWLESEITQKFFETIKHSLDNVEKRIYDGGVLYSERGELFLARDHGQRDSYLDVLTISYEDLVNNNEEDNDAEA